VAADSELEQSGSPAGKSLLGTPSGAAGRRKPVTAGK